MTIIVIHVLISSRLDKTYRFYVHAIATKYQRCYKLFAEPRPWVYDDYGYATGTNLFLRTTLPRRAFAATTTYLAPSFVPTAPTSFYARPNKIRTKFPESWLWVNTTSEYALLCFDSYCILTCLSVCSLCSS